MNKIIKINLIGDFKIQMDFNDGSSKTIDFKQFLGKGISKELLEPSYFSKVEIESGGGLAWPNGYDFCPNYLHDFEGIEEKNRFETAN